MKTTHRPLLAAYRIFITSFLLFSILLFSCKSSQHPKSVEETAEPVEYPVGVIAKYLYTDLSNSVELYPLADEFLENFLLMHTQYAGTHPTVATDFPDQWGVALVERLPEGRELFQIQSQNREWIFLVITSGFGTQRILDVLPVAINLANQTQDILEREIWTTERESDGTFSVLKKYEWNRSVQNVTQKEYEANPQNYLRTLTTTDKYLINNSCRFEKIIIEDIPDYSAVVFYYKNEKPEDWEEVVPMLQAFCEDYSIFSIEANENFEHLQLFDYKFNFITELDVTSYIDLSEGVIFMKKGVTPKEVPFGSYERLNIELKRYFKIVE
jgi:hypothetical protein